MGEEWNEVRESLYEISESLKKIVNLLSERSKLVVTQEIAGTDAVGHWFEIEVLTVSDKAVQVLLDGTKQWFPKKSITNLDEVALVEGNTVKLHFQNWILRKKGLI